MEVVRPSFLASKPFLTYTLIRSWCKSTSKTLLITFFELLFLKNYVMPRGIWRTFSPLPSCFVCSFFFLLLTWVACGRGHHYWVIFRHEARWPLKRFFIYFGPLLNSFKNHHTGPQLHLPFLIDDTHIMGPMSEIIHIFDHLMTQLALVGLRVKVSKCKL
jgi:hypothetical protein